jgi:hypothetical protein
MKIAQFYDPSDRSTPAEIISGNRAGHALDKLVGNLRETVVRNDAPPSDAMPSTGTSTSTTSAGNANPFSAIDEDDVPF